MKKVYVLCRVYPYEGLSIEGVYATYELALARRNKMKDRRQLEIEELEVEGSETRNEE